VLAVFRLTEPNSFGFCSVNQNRKPNIFGLPPALVVTSLGC
jgi:hypothetical protein